MEIKEIIETLKIAIAEVEWNYPMNYGIAFEEAIKILKEKQEREKGCEMCNPLDTKLNYQEANKIFFDKDEIVFMRIDKAKVVFCPSCGRKLGG